MPDSPRLLTVAEVLMITGYKSRTTLWRKVKAGEMPAPVTLSSHAVRWKSELLLAWMDALPAQDYGADTDGGQNGKAH